MWSTSRCCMLCGANSITKRRRLARARRLGWVRGSQKWITDLDARLVLVWLRFEHGDGVFAVLERHKFR